MEKGGGSPKGGCFSFPQTLVRPKWLAEFRVGSHTLRKRLFRRKGGSFSRQMGPRRPPLPHPGTSPPPPPPSPRGRWGVLLKIPGGGGGRGGGGGPGVCTGNLGGGGRGRRGPIYRENEPSFLGARQKGDSGRNRFLQKICGFLRFPAKICGFLRFSAQICDSQIP